MFNNDIRTLKIAVTGAAGQIGYALLPTLISGGVLGPNTRIDLRLIEVEAVLPRLEGTVMELEDCAYDTLSSVNYTSDFGAAVQDADWVLLVGSLPRGVVYNGKKIEERGDLLAINGGIFKEQGRLIGERAAATAQVLVVGNPANTNCYIGQHWAANPSQNWMGMMALDAQRSRAQIAKKLGINVGEVSRMAVWGNHSPTMVPDTLNTLISGKPLADYITDTDWLENTFLKTIQQRGKAVIDARSASSACSAAAAVIETILAIDNPTAANDCFSAAIKSDGSYSIPQDLICGFPLRSNDNGEIEIIQGFDIDASTQKKIDLSVAELESEKAAVAHLLD